MGNFKCPKCPYESDSWSVKRHLERKHKDYFTTQYESDQTSEPQLRTSYMQAYPQVHPEQLVQQQQPVYQPNHSPHTQIISHQNALVTQNQYLQNKVNELQSLLRIQNVQTGETSRKRFRSNSEDETMDTDGEDFLSESDSEESDTDVAHELEDSITDLDINLTSTRKIRKRFLKSLEKYDEIPNEDKRDIFKKYVKLKGNLWMNWYDLDENKEEGNESDENEHESEESEDDGEPEGVTRVRQECSGEDGEDDENQDQENDKECEKNHLMDFVLQLESVANEDDKEEIEKLWKRELREITLKKEAEIDSHETDSEDEEDDDTNQLQKDKKQIEKIIEEFDERGNNYFKHCNKEKIETIGRWCDELNHKHSEIFKNKDNLKKAKKFLRPVALNDDNNKINKLADSNYPISKQRKLLQEVQVGNGIMGVMSTVVLPYIKQLLKKY